MGSDGGTTESGTRHSPGVARFLTAMAIPCLVVAALLGLAYYILIANREDVTPAEAAALQAKSGGIYGSALFYRPGLYKLALYAENPADIVVIGSSRSMEFRAEGFAAPMINLGGNGATIAEAEAVIDRMLEIRRPKALLLIIDYWWFNDLRSDEAAHSNKLGDTNFTLRQLLMPIDWVSEGSATVAGLLSPRRTALDGGPLIGVFANQSHTGFDRYGAYHYVGELTGRLKPYDVKFKATLKRIERGRKDSKLAINAPFSEEMFAQFQALIAKLRASGVTPILAIPPVAPPVYDAMQKRDGPLLNELLVQRLRAAGETVFDFHNPATLGGDACEFLDGYHPGQVTALRMLRGIRSGLADRPDVAALIRPETELTALIDANAGHGALSGPPMTGKEVDFLKLGCAK
jgi:hypothetical protein